MVKLIRYSKKISISKFLFACLTYTLLGQLPPLSSTHPFKKSFLLSFLLRSDISKKAEVRCDQNDPWPCL